MKANIKLESSQFHYVYSDYKIEEIKGKRYVMPIENATKRIVSLTEHIDEMLVEFLNIGKKQFLKEPITNFEFLNFFMQYGSLGFLIDLAINKYFILEEKVIIRDAFYITGKEELDFMNLDEYLKIFFPKSTKKEISTLIKRCKDTAYGTRDDEHLTSIINEYLICSENYAEPVELILNYASALYKNLNSTLTKKSLGIKVSFLNANHLTHNIYDLYYANSLGFKIEYLKQAIDIYYAMQMAQDVRMLKICNFCEKAFIATNPKSEYDSPNCKNKANVYKSRRKNLVDTNGNITVKMPSKELSDSVIKGLKNKK